METALKMKIFQRAQMSLASLGYRPNQSPFNETQLWIFIKVFLHLFSLFAYPVCEANTSKEYMGSIFMIGGVCSITIARVSTLFENATIFDFIDTAEKLLNGRLKNPASEEFHTKANQHVETVCKMINIIILKILSPGFVLPKAIVSYSQYFRTNLGPDSFELSLPLWFPFDWKNPAGYLIAVNLQLIFSETAFEFVDCFLSLAFASLMFIFSLAKDMKHHLNEIDRTIKSKNSRSKVMAQLSELTQFAQLREGANLFSDIYQITLNVLFFGCTGVICLAMLMIQLDISKNDTDSVVLLESLICGSTGVILVAVVYEIGQRCSNTFTDLYKSTCELQWYLYPMEIQQMFVLIIIYAQKSVEIKFFGSNACSREEFKKVVHKVYSYFMILRKLYG